MQPLAPIRFNEPYLTGQELGYLAQVLESGVFGGNGPFGRKAQNWLAERYSVAHVLLTHSCTAALEVAALMFDFQPGDEVILPSYTFVSTASAFMRAGATLRFCEIDPTTMNMDVADVEARITSRTRAIVPVHYAGNSVAMEPLLEMARSRGIDLVEDAAQGLDASWRQHPLGTLGRFGALSFHETKNIHCGLGGALFLNRTGDFERAENIWERGTNRTQMYRGQVDKYSWVELGSSFYPSELQAAFLLAQLEGLTQNTQHREQLFHRYRECLTPLAEQGCFDLPSLTPDGQSNYHCVFVLCRSAAENDRMRAALASKGIQAYIHYVPLHSSKMGLSLGFRAQDLPITEDFASRVLRLPLHNNMTLADVDRVCAGLAQV